MLRTERMDGGKLEGRTGPGRRQHRCQAPRAAPSTMRRLLCGRRRCGSPKKEEKNWVSIEDAAAWAILGQHCLFRRPTSMVTPPTPLAVVLLENSSPSRTPEMMLCVVWYTASSLHRAGRAPAGAKFSHLPKRRRRYCFCSRAQQVHQTNKPALFKISCITGLYKVVNRHRIRHSTFKRSTALNISSIQLPKRAKNETEFLGS